MGLTKEYLRYVPAGNFNIVTSTNCNAVFVALNGQEGRYVAVGACEHVIVFDLRLGEKAQVLLGEKSPATFLCASPNKRNLAVGYADGIVQVYDLETAEVVCVFSGHRSEITTLAYDTYGHKLASGSKDTDVIVWDTVSEAGLCRLSGHRGPITQVTFMSQQPVLISGAKDSFVKFWDLDTQYCFKTLVGHHTEVWALTLVKDDKYLVTGSGDAELRVWKLSVRDVNGDEKPKIENISAQLELATLDENDDCSHPLQCHKACSLLRAGRGRVTSMVTDVSTQILGCQGTDAQIELFYFCTDDEAKARFKKRLRKERKKAEGEGEGELSSRDEIRRLTSLKLPHKPKHHHFAIGTGGELRVLVTFANNTMSLHTLKVHVKDAQAQCLRSIENLGHQSEVRSLSFSSDNLAIVSGSGESIKMWNRQTLACVRTVEVGYVLCTMFVPGDRHVLAGLKDGRLVIMDIAAGDVLEEIPAHSGELWSICLQPDMRGCVTGGGDQTVKFWQFELIADIKTESKAKVLSLLHKRTLKLEDAVLCVRLSPNGKFVAVALLDSTVKIFFADSFKFYLSLYGHKLPVLCMDISSDSTLIATGSADRNLKIWGMDFGDCHKSIFAHDDSITGLQFVPRTHYLFTCGKDGKVKEWDADTYNKIITLQGHVGEAWSLAVSPGGKHVVSSGADRVLRLYEKSDQPLVLQDEEEEERAEREGLATGEQTTVPGQPGLNLPSKKTIGSEKGAESILECLEIIDKYQEQLDEHAALQVNSSQTLPLPQPHPLMQAYGVTANHEFLFEVLKRIRASDLEESLLLLPFSSVCKILEMLPSLLLNNYQNELVCKIAMFLLKIHHAPIVANHALLSNLRQLNKLAMVKVEELRDMVGYNLYGLQLMQKEIEDRESIQLFKDATTKRKTGEKKRRQREKLKRSLITLT
ncbi:hypothetical protein PPYR_14071 [Photinus pyralis]|uniref:Small-subunit processome Utp12 domain-containing protein n=1 Tax=Photinus pyralis TaxID=7054 RepID=A0A5N4A463_PHOPY|nr:WD repeat-containing protein 3 [Photinus pyralis]KAB0792110.1 hypothetical protein PPYR_14071 [Photinus pyralis]